jgi:hypothetical protein
MVLVLRLAFTQDDSPVCLQVQGQPHPAHVARNTHVTHRERTLSRCIYLPDKHTTLHGWSCWHNIPMLPSAIQPPTRTAHL